MVSIRRYRPGDRAAVYDICIRTGRCGGDARPLYRDPNLLPEIFAGPYLVFEPGLAFVLADESDRAVGYILGTSDTPAFVRWFRDTWLPVVAERYPAPAVGAGQAPGGDASALERFMLGLLHDPERMLVDQVRDHPAHLHIDILPEHQGGGHGRALMTAFIGALRQAGVPALHLSMDPANESARRFYDRMGFQPVEVPGSGATFLWRTVQGDAT